MEALIDAEIAAVDWFMEKLEMEQVSTVYIGGGTPSLLPIDLAERLFTGIRRRFAPFEWTVEVNPESVSHEMIDVCVGVGVTRLSLGVQSFDERILSFLGRAGNAAHVRRAVDLIGSFWRGEASLDLMTGIPGQTAGGVLADIDEAIATGYGHLSVYTLTLEEGTPLALAAAAGECGTWPAGEEAEVWEEIASRLVQAGYRHYEVSNFARPGRECRHNLFYWRLDPYIGVGPGAASTLPGADGTVLRLSSTPDINAYISGDPDSAFSVETLSPRSLLLEQLMMGLRLEEGIDRRRVMRRFGCSLEECLGGLWEEWRAQGMVLPAEGAYACTERGRLLLNVLLREAAAEIACRRDLSVVWP